MPPLFPPTGVKIQTVGELTRSIKGILEETHAAVWVEGEVSNLAKPSSGHLYLTLKDDEAPLRAIIYRAIALRLRFDLHDGMRVIVRGRLSVYMPRGEYQLLIEELQPKGIGPLELAFRQLKEKLSVQGYFEPRRKKPLPRIPRRVVLVTSPTGSAVRDMLEVLARRWPAAEVWIYPVHVQGETAAGEVAEAIGVLNRMATLGQIPIDVVLLARGGGSLEDLWPFNEESVARAIFQSRLPIVTGIGHEDDLTIADMVADCRALTPTEAAERVVPDRRAVQEWLQNLELRFRKLLQRGLEAARIRLEELSRRACFRRPTQRIDLERQRLDDSSRRLQRAMEQRLRLAQQQVQAHAAHLDTLSPLRVLARGFSLTWRKGDEHILRDASQVAVGEELITRLDQGTIISRVETIEQPPGQSGPAQE